MAYHIFHVGKIPRIYSKLTGELIPSHPFISLSTLKITHALSWKDSCNTFLLTRGQPSLFHIPALFRQGCFPRAIWPPSYLLPEELGSQKEEFKVESSFSHSKTQSGEVCISLSLDYGYCRGRGSQSAPFASSVLIWGKNIYLMYEMLCELWIDCAF